MTCGCFTNATGGLTAFFGAGTGPIYLDDVACTLGDSQLLECSSKPILTHNCDHRYDAGVKCEGMSFLLSNPKRLTIINIATMARNVLLLQLHAPLVKCD